MASVATLPRSRQLIVLREVAHEALGHYPIAVQRLRVLRFVRNAIFRVDLRNGQWRILRVYRPEYQDPKRAIFEARLLSHLAASSRVRAPRPVPTRDGSLLLEFASVALDGRAFAVLLQPVAGRRPPIASPSARTVHLAGAVMAEIHDEGRAVKAKRRFPHADWGPFVERGLSLPPGLHAHLGEPTIRSLRRHVDGAREFLARTRRDEIGVLHGDFHQGNYLLDRGRVCPIDFGDCATGPFVCDLATAVTALAARAGYAQKRKALLRGYRERRELPASAEDALDSLVAARVGISLSHVFGRADHPYLERRALRNYLALTRARLREVGIGA